MAGSLSGKKIVLVIASEGYHPVEYGVTKENLRKEGAIITTASDKPGGAVAKDNSTTPVDITLDALDAKNYDGIFFIGGPGTLKCLDNPTSYHIISQAKKHNVPYGAICIATRILAKAYGLQDKRATGWNEDLELNVLYPSFGATLVERHPVIIDERVVTAVGPAAADEFAKAIRQVVIEKELSSEE
ncbi:MAG: DJ-1/PfpI family protein [Candidatus Babeliales bacterium]